MKEEMRVGEVEMYKAGGINNELCSSGDRQAAA